MTRNPDLALEHLDNYETELKRKHGVILLTHVPSVASQDHWRSILGSTYHALVEKSELNFGYATLNNDRKKKDAPLIDNTKLQIKVKNIHHVSIRVFAIDLQQYWRLHPTATSIKVDSVDGLCPTWEKELDYSKYPLIQMVEDTIDLEKLAPEVFTGRGAWVIDFVGGRKSCRAIIQKVLYLILFFNVNRKESLHSRLDWEGTRLFQSLFMDNFFQLGSTSTYLERYFCWSFIPYP